MTVDVINNLGALEDTFKYVETDVLKEHKSLWSKEDVTGDADYKKLFYIYFKQVILSLWLSDKRQGNEAWSIEEQIMIKNFLGCKGISLEYPTFPKTISRILYKDYIVGDTTREEKGFEGFVDEMSSCSNSDTDFTLSAPTIGIGTDFIYDTFKVN
jgi:hypothetical protein